MAQLGYEFDASQVKPQGDRTPLPPGEYNVILKSSEIKNTNDNTGRFLSGCWEVVEGPSKGQQMFNNINLTNKNETAQRIGQERLSALCYVCGRLKIQDTAQLHGIPHRVEVTVSDDKKYNEIKAFRTADGRTTDQLVAGGASAAPTAAAPSWAGAPAAAAPAPAPTPAPAPAAAAPPPASPAAPTPPPAAFPPPGWTAHPTSPGYFYQGQEVLTEAQLRAKVAPPSAPAAPTPPPTPAPAPNGAPAPPAGLPSWMGGQG